MPSGNVENGGLPTAVLALSCGGACARGPVGVAVSALLCHGARTRGPVRVTASALLCCGARTRRSVGVAVSAQLCRGARTRGPVGMTASALLCCGARTRGPVGVAVLASRRGVEPRTSAFVAPRSVLLSYRDGAVCAHAPPRAGADRALRRGRPEVARGGREEPSGRFSERHGRSCRIGSLAGSRSPPLGGGPCCAGKSMPEPGVPGNAFNFRPLWTVRRTARRVSPGPGRGPRCTSGRLRASGPPMPRPVRRGSAPARPAPSRVTPPPPVV